MEFTAVDLASLGRDVLLIAVTAYAMFKLMSHMHSNEIAAHNAQIEIHRAQIEVQALALEEAEKRRQEYEKKAEDAYSIANQFSTDLARMEERARHLAETLEHARRRTNWDGHYENPPN